MRHDGWARTQTALVAGFALLAVGGAAIAWLAEGGLPGRALAVLAGLAVPATVASWADRVPPVNVWLAGLVAAAVGALLHGADGALGQPLGGWRWEPAGGPLVLGVLPWVVPGAWLVATLLARGVARWWWLAAAPGGLRGPAIILSATLLGAGLLAGLLATGKCAQWCSAPAAAWPQTVAVLLAGQAGLQVALTPLLLDKFPRERPPGAGPLLVAVPLGLLLVALARG